MAYAAVNCLKHTIERLSNPYNQEILRSAYEKLKFLGNILRRLDDSNDIRVDKTAINELDAEIREAVCKLEDVLESDSLGYKKDVRQEIDAFMQRVKDLGEKYISKLENPLPELDDHAFSGSTKKSTVSVGLSDLSEQIRNELLDSQSGHEVISLVGMAGIGKTHLAAEIFQHPSIDYHFPLKVWVTVGQRHQMESILLHIVSQVTNKPRKHYVGQSMSTLILLLQFFLHHERYLLILDDVWSLDVSGYMMWWLSAKGNTRRRLLMTSRLGKVSVSPSTRVVMMPFLNNEESWNLLCKNVFGEEETFPPQLEKAGRMIAENCEGLPLLILTVAKILCEHDKTEECWKMIADHKTTTFPDAYETISKVLSKSYEFLPQHLKVCFLYMGVLPQKSVIQFRKLINLWSVEDFLERSWRPTFEDMSMQCVEDLVSNSLVIVCGQSSMNKIKSFKLHSAYWHLCVTEARKNKFYHVMRKLTDCSEDYIESQRRLSIQNNALFAVKEVHELIAAAFTMRSLLCTGEDHQYPVPVCLDLKLLKVLDALAIRFYEFPDKVVKLLQLRYLALTHNGGLSPSISELQQLQCLIVRQHHNIKLLEICDEQEVRDAMLRDSTSLPMEIWELQELRYLWIMGRNLPDPGNRPKLPNLVTLYVNAHSCTKDVFTNIPQLKKLGITIELQPDATDQTLRCLEHIKLLDRLESLKCVVVNPRLRSSRVVAPPHHLSNLPWSLKKLSLNGLGYSWKYVKPISSLPQLQVLKLRCSAFQGEEWETSVEFRSLKFLLLEDMDLVSWKIYMHEFFPRLECLIIRHCYKFREIPSEIGEIPTLKMMEVVDCRPSVVASAQKLKGGKNSSLQVVINSSWSHS